jgi:competence protein ComEC
LLPGKEPDAFQSFIFSLRSYIVQTIKKYINGSNQETGIAEALLIGYKEDLDKDLVQAYSNAGVVHIIAISGLHLGSYLCNADTAIEQDSGDQKKQVH